MTTLFKHQAEGVKFLSDRMGAILADDMGLGKTRQAIVALGNISECTNVIVCPASLKLNWEKEIKMVYPDDEVYVAGTPLKYKKLGNPTWLVITYGQIPKWVGPLLELENGFSLVGDEAHYIKHSSARYKFFAMLAKSASRIYLLTGTPMENRPLELYNLLKVIEHPVARTKTSYADRYCNAVPMCLITDKLKGSRFPRHRSESFAFMQDRDRYSVKFYVDMRGASHLDELRSRISDVFLRRTKTEVLDLPEKIVQELPLELSKEWRKKYATAFDDYMDFLRLNPMDGRDADYVDNILMARHLVEIQKLKQVCSQGKMDQIIEDVENALDSGEKVVIFTQYKATLEAYVSKLKKYGVVSISGSDMPKDRERAVVKFQGDDRVRVFVGNIKAAGVGITLTASTNVFFADLDWTPAVHDQAADRCHRIGQTGTVNVRFYIAKDTVEESIAEMLASKRVVITAAMKGDATIGAENALKQVVHSLAQAVV